MKNLLILSMLITLPVFANFDLKDVIENNLKTTENDYSMCGLVQSVRKSEVTFKDGKEITLNTITITNQKDNKDSMVLGSDEIAAVAIQAQLARVIICLTSKENQLIREIEIKKAF